LYVGVSVPVIFITAQAGEAVRAAVLTQGAVECLFKPFSDDELRSALTTAFLSG
jgi:CheY-like chemotaxis protein